MLLLSRLILHPVAVHTAPALFPAMSRFAYNVQYGDFDSDQVEDRGAASPPEVLRAFDEFDWPAEVEASNIHQRCSPTFSVLDVDGDRLFWVSACGEPDAFDFVNEYTFPVAVPVAAPVGFLQRLFGGSPPESRPVVRSPDLTFKDARVAIELFLSGDHLGLLEFLTSGNP